MDGWRYVFSDPPLSLGPKTASYMFLLRPSPQAPRPPPKEKENRARRKKKTKPESISSLPFLLLSFLLPRPTSKLPSLPQVASHPINRPRCPRGQPRPSNARPWWKGLLEVYAMAHNFSTCGKKVPITFPRARVNDVINHGSFRIPPTYHIVHLRTRGDPSMREGLTQYLGASRDRQRGTAGLFHGNICLLCTVRSAVVYR